MTFRYLLRRILLAIPTTFLLLVVLFVLVNLVPASDPVAPEQGTGAVSREVARTSDRLFREQFGLDLPVLLNWNWTVDAEDVGAMLEVACPASDPPADPARVDLVAREEARREIVELGRFAVRPLLALAGEDKRAERQRDLALALAVEAGSEIVRPRDAAGERERKRDGNRMLEALRPPTGSAGAPTLPDAAARARTLAAWEDLPDDLRSRFAPSALQRWSATLTETRFGVYLANLAHLDFGSALADRQPVLPALWTRLKRSLALGGGYVVFSLAASIPLGILLASLRRSRAQRPVAFLFSVLYCAPTFFVALLLQRIFALGEPFSWLPIGGFRSHEIASSGTTAERWLDVARHLVLPVLVLSLPTIAILTRYLQGALEEAMRSDYVRAARAKGLSERQALLHHALRNALLPLATVVGYMVPALVSGAAVIEFIFDYPGIGEYFVNAVVANDFNVILAVTLLSALATQIGFLLSDVLLAMLDPRIDLAAEGAQ